jgi:predicted dinucleotide-binding enzyme
VSSRVGIIGAGRLGQAMARTLRAGREVVLDVPWPRGPAAVEGLDRSGRIVVDATNDFDPSDLNGGTSSEVTRLMRTLARPAPSTRTPR